MVGACGCYGLEMVGIAGAGFPEMAASFFERLGVGNAFFLVWESREHARGERRCVVSDIRLTAVHISFIVFSELLRI